MNTKLSPLKAIKLHCSICNGEVKGGKKYDCLAIECTLYPWKEGKGTYEIPESITEEHKNYIKTLEEPVRKQRKGRIMSEEHKAKLVASKKTYWENKKNGIPN